MKHEISDKNLPKTIDSLKNIYFVTDVRIIATPKS